MSDSDSSQSATPDRVSSPSDSGTADSPKDETRNLMSVLEAVPETTASARIARGGLGRGKMGGMRHPQVKMKRDVPNAPSIKRMIRRAGGRRISSWTTKAVPAITRDYVSEVLRRAIMIARHAKRKTITKADVHYALKSMDRPLY